MKYRDYGTLERRSVSSLTDKERQTRRVKNCSFLMWSEAASVVAMTAGYKRWFQGVYFIIFPTLFLLVLAIWLIKLIRNARIESSKPIYRNNSYRLFLIRNTMMTVFGFLCSLSTVQYNAVQGVREGELNFLLFAFFTWSFVLPYAIAIYRKFIMPIRQARNEYRANTPQRKKQKGPTRLNKEWWLELWVKIGTGKNDRN